MDAWWTNFKTYLAESRNLSDWRSILKSFDKTETEIKSPFEAPESGNDSRNRNSFEFLLSQFLFSRHGSKFKRNFRFDGNLTCNQPAPPIKVKIQLNVLQIKTKQFYDHIMQKLVKTQKSIRCQVLA